MGKLIILRGLPGSGKSTKAKKLAGETGIICSTDDFFMTPFEHKDAKYSFDATKLQEAHKWNQEKTFLAMRGGSQLIIIDNTNTMAWEAAPYVRAAQKHSYDVGFVESDAPWAKIPLECAKRNTHGVPLEAIERMLARWESDLTVELCLNAKPPWYKKKNGLA